MSVDIHLIRTDGGTQSRAAINEATVAEYAEAMADENAVFPPVTIYFDGREYWLADGFHRVAAWARIGRIDIPADVRQGDRRRAILHSVAANAAHGLRRTNDDKRRAVLTLLEDAEWSQWHDAKIAEQCRVSTEMVAAVRTGLTCGRPQVSVREAVEIRREQKLAIVQEPHLPTSVSEDAPILRKYINKHGQEAVMNVANIGRVKPDTAQKPIQEADPPEPTEEPADAKARRALAKLTREALEDDVLGLRADLADAKAKLRELKAESADLKGRLRDLESTDQGEVIRRLQAEVRSAGSEKWRQTELHGEAMKQVYALKKRVAELEAADANQMIPLN